LYRRLGGPQGFSGWVWKISPPPMGFNPQTVQSMAFFIGVMKITIIGVDLSFKYHYMFEKLFLVPSDELWSANF
jgi:hypothetical protein